MGSSRSRDGLVVDGRSCGGRSGDEAESPIRVGVSSCLLGNHVRYDSGHKHDRYITDVLGGYFEFVAVCPEVEMGLGVPRETLRLVREAGRGDDDIRLVAPASDSDHTETMARWARARVRDIAKMDLSGFLLKKGSPSCGMDRVRVYTTKGMPSVSGRGRFADALMAHLPLLPVEEEGRLNDAALRENFITRVFAYRRLSDLFRPRWRIGDLVEFHASEKMLLLAHQPVAEKELGRLVAGAKGRPRGEVADGYRTRFLEALSKPVRRRRHVNVLQHMVGHFRGRMDDGARAALAVAIDDFQAERAPLLVPLTLVRHYAQVLDVAYLARQSYLEPHPQELMLRNHA